MRDQDKTKTQLIDELAQMSQRLAELEAPETERKRAEEVLRESEERYRTVFETVRASIILIDKEGRMIDVSPYHITNIGKGKITKEDLVGKNIITHPTIVNAGLSETYKRVLEGEPFDIQDAYFPTLLSGGDGYFNVKGMPLFQDEEVIGAVVTHEDITERKQAEEEIRVFQRRLRSLASRLSLAEERERKRLAAGVHDQIGQQLAVLQIKLGAMREPLSSTGLKEQLDEIRELVGQTISNTRSLTFELSPPILYELGLEPALEWLVEQVQAEYGLMGRFEDDGQTKPLADDARGFVFWAVRELLMNVVRHARVQAVMVSVCRDDGELRVVVEDNGVGFDTLEMERRTRGFGLFSIRERLTEFGGQFEVESEPGRGTRVTLAVPLEGTASAGGN